MSMDPQSLDEETIQKQKAELVKIEKNIKSSESIKDEQAKDYENLLNEFGDLKTDMQNDYENSIKTLQKRNEGWINETTTTMETSRALMGDLKDKLEDDNPFMKRFIRKLNNAREKHTQLKNKNDENMVTMQNLSNRKVDDEDYLSFIIELSEDQNESDMYIKDTKRSAEDLLKLLNTVNDELDDFDKSSKDEIVSECRDNITSKSKELANLEEKLVKLEKEVSANLRTTDNALQVIDKDHPDYSEVSKADQDLKNLDRDTRDLRLTLDRTTIEIQSIIKRVEGGIDNFTMSDIMEIQKQTSQVCRDYDDLSDGIDDGLSRLQKFVFELERLLKGIKDQLKSETEEVIITITEKITIIKRFLDPKSKDPNSVQRQWSLKELLETVYLTTEDTEYTQYIIYTELIKTSLAKCENATKNLNTLDGDVTKVTNNFNKALKKDDSIINQIDQIQITFQSIRDNKTPANDLKKTTDEISKEIDSEKEQEIIEFLDKIKGQKFGNAQERIDKLQIDLTELERRLNEVNGENDSFTSQLSKALGTSKTREKSNLIDLLIRDSDGSKKDLKRIKTQSIEIYETVNQKGISRLSLKELKELLILVERYEITITKKVTEIETIDEEIEERKKRWRDFLVRTEAKEKMNKELLSLIPLLREKYEKMSKAFNFSNNSLNGFFLVNEKIKEFESYETDETPCIDREQRKQQIGEMGDKLKNYEPNVDRIESYDAKKLKSTEQEKIESLIQEATDLISSLEEDNRTFEEIMIYLREERRDFKDGDSYTNQRRVERLIAVSDERLQTIINEFELIKDTLENSDVTNSKLKHRMKEIENNVVDAGEMLDKAKSAYEEASSEMDKEDMGTAKLAILAVIIEKFGIASKELHDLTEIFDVTDNIFKELQTELVDLYYAKKLKDLMNVIRMLLDRLNKLNDLIVKLIELSKEFEGFTSDNEEEEFVNDLEGELHEVKKHHNEGEEELAGLEKQIVQLQDELAQNPPQVDEDKADRVDSAISDLSKMIEDIERLVDSKIQRFADMDPYKKFRRREKELSKLQSMLSDKEDILVELKHECTADLKNKDASAELKDCAKEVISEVDDLEENLGNLKDRLQMLDNEIQEYLEKSAKTEMTIEEIFELLYANVEVKKKLKMFFSGIDEFFKSLSNVRKKYMLKKAESPPTKSYKATKGDQMDEMLGQWINTHGCEFEIRRLGGGFYMFGEKKIYAKIINGKLIIRVGGGYMSIDEFMQHYGALELARQQRDYEIEYESLKYEDLLNDEDNGSSPSSKNEVMSAADAKKSLRAGFSGSFVGSKKQQSPMRGSPRTTKHGMQRHGSPSNTFAKKAKLGTSPRASGKVARSPKSKMSASFRIKDMPSASNIEESLRKMEEDAKGGKIKDGYNNMTYKK